MHKQIDVLAIATHPDDAELFAGGTLLRMKSLGYTIGIIDLTQGELGTRGTAETRRAESAEATRLLQLDVRQNLGMPDGFFQNTREYQLAIIQVLRRYRPSIVLANAPEDRHPDHGRGSQLINDACFLSGLRKIETTDNGQPQAEHRPAKVLFGIQDRHLKPNIVVDVTPWFEQKMEAVLAYRTQFYQENANNDSEPRTHISGAEYLEYLRARARTMGHMIGAHYGEGFILPDAIPVPDLVQQFASKK